LESKQIWRSVTCVVLLLAIFAGFGVRLIQWQVFEGASYRQKADSTNTYTVKVAPTRGEILDVNGVDLAINITGYQVVFDKLFMEKGSENDIILRLVALFGARGAEWVDVLPIVVTEAGTFAYAADKEKEVAALQQFLNVNSYTTAEDCMKHLAGEDYYNCADRTPQEQRDIVSVRYNMQKSGFSSSVQYVFAEEVDADMVAILAENSGKIPGVTVNTTNLRKYVNGTLMPHIVGNIGAISEKEYKEHKDEGGYYLNSKFGKTGVEKAFESILRGKEGEKVVETTKGGTLVNMEQTVNAEPGNTVYLTLDARLQKVASESLERNVNAAREAGEAEAQRKGESKQGEDTSSGSVVALDVKNGFAVLCAQNYPSFDMTRAMEDAEYYQALLTDNERTPLINRAFEATYAPGSIFKPSVALAALQENIITPATTFFCSGRFTRFSPDGPKCMGVHHNINMHTAISKSCNVFFMETGFQTGITTMNRYAKLLGLGQPTGVEIDEALGTLAGKEERQSRPNPASWYDGDTAAAAIGQSDNLFTPLQLATYVATIANDGVRMKTHVVDKITDYSRENVVQKTQPEQVCDIGVSPENIQLVQDAMRETVLTGTARSVFGNYGVAVAAKTGTAQNSGSDHTTFICYAPFDDPQIAVAVVIEHGAKGAYSMGVAKDILDAYFYGTGMEDIPETNPDGTVASSQPASSQAASSAQQ
jgi:penicillin-binding protein 2